MTIRPFLQGQVFPPEKVAIMGIAFENACRQLGLDNKKDSLTRVVARTVIQMADRDIHDPDELTRAVMQQFQRTPEPGTPQVA
jgi:hypothetical protein